MKVHGATVQQVSVTQLGRLIGYEGVCLATGATSSPRLGIPQDEEPEGEAIARALDYLNCAWSRRCRARHVMEHDRKARR